MSDNQSGFGSGILRGLKNILFTPDPTSSQTPMPTPISPAPAPKEVKETSTSRIEPSIPQDSDKDTKLRVYQLLENMNKPGCDFFEVWNAATEMGGASVSNIKAAFTSLKYADKSLTKAKLVETGEFYMANLKNVLAAETGKLREEKTILDREKEQLKTNLAADIASLEQQIAALKEKLAGKKTERDNINQKYEPKISEIDVRITSGQQSVNGVLAEMMQVFEIIQKELN
jgi:hypothetical protein